VATSVGRPLDEVALSAADVLVIAQRPEMGADRGR